MKNRLNAVILGGFLVALSASGASAGEAITARADVYEKANTYSRKTCALEEGTRVTILNDNKTDKDRKRGWYHVTGAGCSGYIRTFLAAPYTTGENAMSNRFRSSLLRKYVPNKNRSDVLAVGVSGFSEDELALAGSASIATNFRQLDVIEQMNADSNDIRELEKIAAQEREKM